MIRKDVIFAVFTTFCLCALIFYVVPINSQLPYDPWIDENEDGKINMYDVGYTAQRFGALGDPTKNVTVTNWPKSEGVEVWYQEVLENGASVGSIKFSSDGFSTLHILVFIFGLEGAETVALTVIAPLYNGNHTYFYPIPVYTYTYNQTVYLSSTAIDVPMESFYFLLHAGSGTNCTASLSYYLTWA